MPVADCGELQVRLAAVRGRQRPGLLHLTHVFRRQEVLGTLWLYSCIAATSTKKAYGAANGRANRITRRSRSCRGAGRPLLDWPRCVATPRLAGRGGWHLCQPHGGLPGGCERARLTFPTSPAG